MGVTVIEAAKIAQAIYAEVSDPGGLRVEGYQQGQAVEEPGTGRFCMGYWVSDDDNFAVLSIRGSITTGNDWLSNNLNIATSRIPIRLQDTYNQLKAWSEVLKPRQIVVTGHSLGGGLAQVVGFHLQLPFVTFNAPPMRNFLTGKLFIKAAGVIDPVTADQYEKGSNYRLNNDPVSACPGWHIGPLYSRASPTNNPMAAHLMDAMIDGLSGLEQRVV